MFKKHGKCILSKKKGYDSPPHRHHNPLCHIMLELLSIWNDEMLQGKTAYIPDELLKLGYGTYSYLIKIQNTR